MQLFSQNKLQAKQANFPWSSLPLLAALGSIMIGLPCILGGFGPTETEVGVWGLVSLGVGIMLALLYLGHQYNDGWFFKVGLTGNYILLALLQGLPILLWFEFHGMGISDGTPPSSFVAHWGYAIPHMALVVISIMGIFLLFRGIFVGYFKK